MRLTLLAPAAALLLSLAGSVTAAPLEGGRQPYLVLFRDSGSGVAAEGDLADDLDSLRELRKHDPRVRRLFRLVRAASVELTPEAARALAASPLVEVVEPDGEVHAFAQQTPYGIAQVRAPQVWNRSTGGGVKVAVVDTGIDYNHPDLRNSYSGGWDFVNNDADPLDDNEHGTHVAGTIAAANNSEGVVGVAYAASIYALKVLDEEGSGRTSSIIAAVEWAVDHGMHIVNMSLGSSASSITQEAAMDEAYARGLLLIAASGNEDGSDVAFPAGYDSVIAVGATDNRNVLAGFSNLGPDQELVAPGVGVLSTIRLGLGALASLANQTTGTNFGANPMTFSAFGDVTADAYFCDVGNPADFPSGVSGYVAVIRRGGVNASPGDFTFEVKATNARAAGAAAVVIVNNVPGSFFGTLGHPDAWPVVVSMSQEDGNPLIGSTAVRMPIGARLRVRVTSNDYATFSGTSMASPHVAGVAALLKKIRPSATNVQLRAALTASAVDLGPAGRDQRFGFGLVDAAAALAALEGGGSTPPPSPQGFTASFAAATVSLAWTDVAGEDGYRLYRRAGAESAQLIATLGAGIVAATDSGLAGGITYTYELAAFNDAGESVPRASAAVAVPQLIVADFLFAPLNPAAGQPVLFTDVSAGGVTQWSWDFGDGSSAQAAVPSHTFAAVGEYDVRLIASSSGAASGTVVKRIVIGSAAAPQSSVPVVARIVGGGSTQWKTRLAAHNRSATATTNVAVRLLLSNAANPDPLTRIVSLAPGETRVFADVVGELFGRDGVSGSLLVEGDADVATRTYASVAGRAGTYGQFIPAVDAAALAASIEPWELTGLRTGGDFRTNIGALASGSAAAALALELFDSAGTLAGEGTLDVQATSHTQSRLETLFPGLPLDSGGVYRLRLRPLAGGAVPYASIVEQHTGDPVYLAAQRSAGAGNLFVVATGRGAGEEGTFFTSSLTLTSTATVTTTGIAVSYLASGADNSVPVRHELPALAPGASMTFADILGELGIVSGAGALRIEWTNSENAAPIATSRTSTPSPGIVGGSYGQGIRGQSEAAAASPRLQFHGVEVSPAFRSNVVVVNMAGTANRVTITVRANGAVVGTPFETTLPPFSYFQRNLAGLVPALAGGNRPNLSVQVDGADGSVSGIVSTIDNTSGDPYAVFPTGS